MTVDLTKSYYNAGAAWPGHCDHCGSWKFDRQKYRCYEDPGLVIRVCFHCATAFGK